MQWSWRRTGRLLAAGLAAALLLAACSSHHHDDAANSGSTGDTGNGGNSGSATSTTLSTTTTTSTTAPSRTADSVASATGQTLYSWGLFGSNGAITAAIDTPLQVTGIPGTIKQIATSNSDTYALTTTGTVWAFGANQYGELGNGTSVAPSSYFSPEQVIFPATVRIAQLANPMPYDTAIAIDTTGHAWGWGYNGHSDLCLGDNAEALAPVELPFTGVTLAAGAGEHASYAANSVLYSCGQDQYGQLGNGTVFDAANPVAVHGLPAGTIIAVESSYGASGALFASGQYYDWGLNDFGQLGNGSTADSAVPQLVALPAPVSQVFQGSSATSDGQTLVTLSNGSLEAWGADGYGQLCNGDASTTVASPVPIVPPAGSHWTQVFSGGKTTYAIDSGNNLWGCGFDGNGQLGIGSISGQPHAVPVKILSDVTLFSSTQSNQAALVAP